MYTKSIGSESNLEHVNSHQATNTTANKHIFLHEGDKGNGLLHIKFI